MSGLFASFGVANRGMSTQQKALQVTSHNIANANTEGYSRQRAQIQTTKPFGMPYMHSEISPGQLGTGCEVTAIVRVRDNFLDFQVRKEVNVLGTYQYRDRYLSEVEGVFNEPTEYGLSTMISKFFESWHTLSKQPENSNARTVVAHQAQALAKELNHTYKQLENTRENVHSEIKQTVNNVNSILNQLDDLNQQIMSVKISNQEPNDLMDKRDLLLDSLSEALNITIDKREFYSIDVKPGNTENLPGIGQDVLVRKEPNYAVSRFSYITGIKKIENPDGTYNISLDYSKLGGANETGKIEITNVSADKVESIIKDIDQSRVIWADESGKAYNESIDGSNANGIKGQLGIFIPDNGELKGLMSIQEDLDKYQSQLDKLAGGLALAINSIYSPNGPEQLQDGTMESKDLQYFFVNGDVNSDYDEMKITAANIAINPELLKDVMKIKTGSKYDGTSGESDGNRALAIAQVQYALIEFANMNSKDIKSRQDFLDKLTGGLEVSDELGGVLTLKNKVTGTKADAYFKDIVDELGIQRSEAKRIVGNQNTLLANFEERRASVSGVSLDEEMTNLIQFQHAYQANAKMISVIDQLLDVVVNGLIK